MKLRFLTVALLVALVAAGAASAYALRTIILQPGRCATISKLRVCAARRVVTVTNTVTQTVTTTPAPPQLQTFTGNGGDTLQPWDLPKGGSVTFLGCGVMYINGPSRYIVSSGNTSYLPPGYYGDVEVAGFGCSWTVTLARNT